MVNSDEPITRDSRNLDGELDISTDRRETFCWISKTGGVPLMQFRLLNPNLESIWRFIEVISVDKGS